MICFVSCLIFSYSFALLLLHVQFYNVIMFFEKNYLGSLLGRGVINVPYLYLNQCLLGLHNIGEDSMNTVLFLFLFVLFPLFMFFLFIIMFTIVTCTIEFILHRSDLLDLILSCLSLSTSMP